MLRNTWLVVETILVFVGVSALAVYLHQFPFEHLAIKWSVLGGLILFQGLWFYRFYLVGHESSHRKLFPKHRLANDVLGSLILLPIMTPVNVFRKIHLFHHGFNRKDNHTSNLDTFTVKKPSRVKTVYIYTLWYIGVFGGGMFLHSLISVFLFLFMPPKVARKISPAFNGWTYRDQLMAIVLFGLGVGLHLLVYYLWGLDVYLWTLGYPLLSFGWVMSLLFYSLHYDTTVGEQVRYNARAVKGMPFFSWLLMNFNEHVTHHQYPNIPWYELAKKRADLPAEFEQKNQKTKNLFIAILQQIKGPRIVYENKN